MARTVTVGKLQDMQRENPSASSGQATAAPEPNQDDEATARLKAVGYGGEQTGSDSSTTAETAKAEPAAGPREYDVDQSGSVRDWRRPDTTPDRGEDAAEQHVYIRDENGDLPTFEPRFSGGGDGEAQQQSMFMVPNDSDFRGRLYRDAPELAMLASDLIEKHGYLGHLEHCLISFQWKRKTGSAKRQRITGGIKRGSDHYGQLLGAEFMIFLAADTARERHHTDRHVSRSLFRQLGRIGQDDKGNWIELPYAIQLHPEEIQEYADLDDEDLRIARRAHRTAEQMGLFSEDEDDAEDGGTDLDCRNCGGTVSMERPLTGGLCEACIEEQAEDAHRRDGSGVLIHADGSPMTAAEIEAMERHDLEDDDDDILADPAVI